MQCEVKLILPAFKKNAKKGTPSSDFDKTQHLSTFLNASQSPGNVEVTDGNQPKTAPHSPKHLH